MSELGVPQLLAIDDNQESLELITAALASERLQVLTASDPEVGFEILLLVRPRIVLLDLVMPQVSGIELLERIVGIDQGVDVILFTAHYSAECSPSQS
jgi:DNA-binding response OmpR family regulator